MSLVNNRLPKTVLPTNYKIYMEPDIDKFTFDGSVMININVLELRRDIILNSKNLVIISVFFNEINIPFEEDKDNEIIILKTDIVNKGLHNIFITFTGILNDQMEGFYRSKYKLNGITKYMATTQFEATDARQAFPCFDEPNFKATFDITINGPVDKTILSNMPIKSSRENIMNKKIVTFETTPIMSTYLVAFIISDLEYLEMKTFNDITVRVYATPENKLKLQFALDVTVKSLEWYIKWFGIDYPLAKLDLVSIPDFSAGAMENWGLITFRECSMLCDEHTELNEKKEIVMTICHELAHQWFGNLVTMEWWTYLWLNESMATYFGWMVTDILYPEWKIWNKFMEQEYTIALELDSLETSHPIEVPVKKASDVQQIFDAISYSKGSCLIRLLVNYMGLDEFRMGMQKYLNKNKYSNTVSNDLWDAFGNDIKKLMESWIKQSGYPVLCINSIDSNKLVLSQTRFYKYGSYRNTPLFNKLIQKDFNSIEHANNISQIWIVPINIRLPDSNIISIILDNAIGVYQINSDNILVNPKRIGFYRVKYTNSPNIENMLNEDKVHLIDDSFNLAMSGYQGFSESFQMVKDLNLLTERNSCIWNAIIPYMNMIYSYLEYHKNVQDQYKYKILLPIFKPLELLINEIGWDDSEFKSINDYELRNTVIEELAFEENQKIIYEALARFRNNNWLNSKSIILPIVGKYGSINDYNKLMEIYETSTNPQIVDSLLVAFGSVQNPELIQLSMRLILSDKIKEQDLWYFIRCMSLNEKTRDLVWDLVTSNWDKFIKKYPPGSSSITYLIKSMGSGFMTEEQLNKFKNFFNINPIKGTEMAVDQTIEKIINKILIIDRILNDPVFKQEKLNTRTISKSF